jgi:hypothetical protein
MTSQLFENAAHLFRSAWSVRRAAGAAGAQFVDPESTPNVLLGFDAAGQATPAGATTLQRIGITQAGPWQDYVCPPQWWTIEIATRGLQSISQAVAQQTTRPWNDLDVNGFRSCQQAKILIVANGDTVRLDAISNRYSVFSDTLTVLLEVPAPAVSLGQGTQGVNTNGIRNLGAGVLLGQVAVEATIRSNVASLGHRTGQLTQTVLTVNGGVNLIAIPTRARHVVFYQDSAGPSPAPAMNWTTATPAGPVVFDRGRIDFNAGMFRTERLAIPGNAQFVNIGGDVRRLTAVWEIEL